MPSSDSHHTLAYPEDPVQLFRRLCRLPWAMWLDSGCDNEGSSRYDLMVAAPVCTLLTRGGITRVTSARRPTYTDAGDPLLLLRAEMHRHGVTGAAAKGPFAGGAMGYFSYELGRQLAGLPPRPGDEPEMAVGIYRWALIRDRCQRTLYLTGAVEESPDLPPAGEGAMVAPHGTGTGAPSPAMDAGAYARAFAAVQGYIRDGDCYQVNLANRFRVPFDGDPLSAYAWLRRRAGGPFSAFLDVPQVQVLSLSPERFLWADGRRVETWPIKGTRPRRDDPARDARERAALQASDKDRAENVMIVDLLRNDLGKVCRPGSVRVPALCRLESYSTVHHLVSHVTGELRADCDAIELLRACLPGGSITGAPKRRAMEIIDELEPAPRGVYCGAIGYLGFDGRLDLNIAIRTATCTRGRMDYWAGGGLVADSGCEAEYEEIHHKARAFLELFGAA